jgi:hypothetical protein
VPGHWWQPQQAAETTPDTLCTSFFLGGILQVKSICLQLFIKRCKWKSINATPEAKASTLACLVVVLRQLIGQRVTGSVWRDLQLVKLLLTVRGFVQRGFQGFKVSKGTRTSKQRDDFLKLKSPRCAKPLLVVRCISAILHFVINLSRYSF